MTDRTEAARASGSGPFDPAGVTWVRVSPRLVTARMAMSVVLLGGPAIVLALGAATMGLRWLAVPAGVFFLALLWCVVVVPRAVRAIGYAERADDLLIRKGLLVTNLVVVPYGRMQYVDVEAGPLDRRLGIARVQLHTASPGTDAAIPGLVPAEAERLRDRLASRGEAQLAGL